MRTFSKRKTLRGDIIQTEEKGTVITGGNEPDRENENTPHECKCNEGELTDSQLIEYLLSEIHVDGEGKMKGTIRPAPRHRTCDCGASFKLVNAKLGYICKKCRAMPRRFTIDLYFSGKRIYVYSDKQGQPLDTYARALKLHSHIQTQIEAHTFDPRDYIKSEIEQFFFSTRIREWFITKEAELKRGNLAPATLKTYRIYTENYLKPFFGDKDIRELRTYDIERFYHSLPPSRSPKYHKCVLDCLKVFLRAMMRLEYIQKLPVFPVIRIEEKLPAWTTREIQDKILALIPGVDRAFFIFLTRQGLRPGEARALKIKDVDFATNTIRVARTFSESVLIERTKTRKERIRLINPELLPLLAELCKNRFGEEHVFVNSRTGRHYADKTVNKIWNDACEKAEVQIDLYNGTRHSVASQAASAGAPLQAIKAVLGHTDIRTTLKYAHNDLSSQLIVFEKANGKVTSLIGVQPGCKASSEGN